MFLYKEETYISVAETFSHKDVSIHSSRMHGCDADFQSWYQSCFHKRAVESEVHSGFVSVAMDTLKICNSFALIRSDDRQALAALGGLTMEVDHMNGVEPENSGDVIHVDDDSAFSAYRDNAEDSDSSDVEG